MVKVVLHFRAPFYEWFGMQEYHFYVTRGTTIRMAILQLMDMPQFSIVAHENNGVLFGELHALYSINGCVVDKNISLDKDTIITVLIPMMGG